MAAVVSGHYEIYVTAVVACDHTGHGAKYTIISGVIGDGSV